MDSLLGPELFSVDLVQTFSPILTDIMNNILGGCVTVDMCTVLGLCSILLLGDESSPPGEKALAQIGRVRTPCTKAVIHVTIVKDDLVRILAYRGGILKLLEMKGSATDCVTVLGDCCRLIMVPPHLTNERIMDPISNERGTFSFSTVCGTTKPRKTKPSETKSSGDIAPRDLPENQLAARVLLDLHSSPVRHFKGDDEVIHTDVSTMSGTSEVERLTPRAVKSASRRLEDYLGVNN